LRSGLGWVSPVNGAVLERTAGLSDESPAEAG